jgi:hypothetical protein
MGSGVPPSWLGLGKASSVPESHRARIERLRQGVEAALDRFYSEGYWEWPRAEFAGLIEPDLAFDDPVVARWLEEWERNGNVAIPAREDRYIRVLKPFIE